MLAQERIRKLIVLGDNRMEQGLPAKARESYAEALELAREEGIDASLGALIELRLADLDAPDSTG
jgi:predicted negative regulator of RcsB-dependent stress response